MNYSKLANIETYIFTEVHEKFHQNHEIDAFDFFCIAIFKANRAKSKLAKRIIDKFGDLENGCITISKTVYNAANHKERYIYLRFECGFGLPTVSAYLSVFYPNDFSIYDYRVCDMLDKHHKAKSKINRDSSWEAYQAYLADVKPFIPKGGTFRDADKILWGKSFYEGLVKNIEESFNQL
jgi:hypothetical protein